MGHDDHAEIRTRLHRSTRERLPGRCASAREKPVRQSVALSDVRNHRTAPPVRAPRGPAACRSACAPASSTAALTRAGCIRDGSVGLGIQRLRVIDLATGDQPIYNEDRSVAVVLNGEIYNYRELREELSARGHTLRHAGRHRGDRPPLRGVRRRLRPAAARDVRVRALGRAPAAAADRARPGRQEAAVLRRARRRPELRLRAARRCSQDHEIPREVDPRRSTPTCLRLRARRRSRRCAGVAQAAAGAHARLSATAAREIQRYWQLDYSAQARRRAGRGAVRADPRRAARGDPQAADRRRAARRVPLRRDRLLGGRRGDGAAVDRAGADLLDRLRPRGVRRAAARARGSRSSSGPTTRSSRSGADAVDDPAADRPPLRRAVRRLLGDPELLPLRADPPARHRRAQRRRRRRVVRRLHALRGQRARRRGSTGSRRRSAARVAAARRPAARAAATSERRATASRRLAGALALDAARALRALHVAGSTRAQRDALYTPEFAARGATPTPTTRSRAPWAAASGRLGRSTDARGRRRRPTSPTTCSRRSTSRRWRTRLEARSPLLDHELMELAASIPADAEGARRARRSGSSARRCAAGCPDDLLDRPSRASRCRSSTWLRGDLRAWSREILLDPRDARPRLLPSATRSRRCSTATRPAPTTTTSGSGRC